MKHVLIASALLCLGTTGCVAGPGGVHNAANRTLAGSALGALLGGVAGAAAGDVSGGAVIGAIAGGGIGAVVGAVAGGALGAAVNPDTVFRRDTRGYCYTVDAQGQPITILANAADCRAANGTPAAKEHP